MLRSDAGAGSAACADGGAGAGPGAADGGVGGGDEGGGGGVAGRDEAAWDAEASAFVRTLFTQSKAQSTLNRRIYRLYKSIGDRVCEGLAFRAGLEEAGYVIGGSLAKGTGVVGERDVDMLVCVELPTPHIESADSIGADDASAQGSKTYTVGDGAYAAPVMLAHLHAAVVELAKAHTTSIAEVVLDPPSVCFTYRGRHFGQDFVLHFDLLPAFRSGDVNSEEQIKTADDARALREERAAAKPAAGPASGRAQLEAATAVHVRVSSAARRVVGRDALLIPRGGGSKGFMLTHTLDEQRAWRRLCRDYKWAKECVRLLKVQKARRHWRLGGCVFEVLVARVARQGLWRNDAKLGNYRCVMAELLRVLQGEAPTVRHELDGCDLLRSLSAEGRAAIVADVARSLRCLDTGAAPSMDALLGRVLR